jgi:hypothetical protein
MHDGSPFKPFLKMLTRPGQQTAGDHQRQHLGCSGGQPAGSEEPSGRKVDRHGHRHVGHHEAGGSEQAEGHAVEGEGWERERAQALAEVLEHEPLAHREVRQAREGWEVVEVAVAIGGGDREGFAYRQADDPIQGDGQRGNQGQGQRADASEPI